MLRHYLTVAARVLRRDWSYTVLNVAGLAVALAACIVIGLFVRHERSYDRFFPNANHVYRVVQDSPTTPGATIIQSPVGLAGELAESAPEVRHATVVERVSGQFTRGREPFDIERTFVVDKAFLDIFPYRLLRGDAGTALDRPGTLVLTESESHRLFGDADPMGQSVSRSDSWGVTEHTVTGVMEDPPTNAHVRPQALISLSEDGRRARYGSAVNWSFFGGSLYLELVPGSVAGDLARTIGGMERGVDRVEDSPFHLQPVTGIHLHSTATHEMAPQGDARYLVLFTTVGLLILLLACVNYVNLATVKSARRAREIGLRRTMGAGRAQLAGQFLSESVVLCALALPVALTLAALAIPAVNRIAGLELTLGGLADGWGAGALVALLLTVGVGSGLYPAVVLARLRPVQALRGQGGGGRRSLLRSGLTTFQLFSAALLVVCTLVVQRQLDYIQSFPLGFDQERVVTFPISQVSSEQFSAFRQEVSRSSAVAAVTSGVPLGIEYKSTMRPPEPASGRTEWLSEIVAGDGYVEAMGLTLLAGRTSLPTSEGQAVLLTEAAVRSLGLEGDPLGQEVYGSTVIGVVADIHNASLRGVIEPLTFILTDQAVGYGIVRLRPEATRAGLDAIERAWAEVVSSRPLDYSFLDDDIQAQYQSDERLARVFGLFSGLAVFIAALGLVGLVAYTVQQRTKEVGVRKVLGATVTSLVMLLVWEFVRLVGLALLVTVPLGLFLAHRWLSEFAYQVDVGPAVFIIAGALLMAVVVLTASAQALRAATADPVRALRSE